MTHADKRLIECPECDGKGGVGYFDMIKGYIWHTCLTCKGSGKIIEDELIPIEVPEGFFFLTYSSRKRRYAIFARCFKIDVKIKAPYKTGVSTLTCETCCGSGTKDNYPFECRDSCPPHIFDCKKCGFYVCPTCHGKPVIKIDTKISVIEKDDKYFFECKWEVVE